MPTYLPNYQPTSQLPACLPTYLPTCLPTYITTSLPPAYLPVYLSTNLPPSLPVYLPPYRFFLVVGVGVASYPASGPVPREHSFSGACSEPLDPSPWLSLSLLQRPLNIAVKGLGVRHFIRIWELPGRHSLFRHAHMHTHTHSHAHRHTHLFARRPSGPRVRGWSFAVFPLLLRLVCNYMTKIARNLVPRFRPAQHDFDHSGSKGAPILCCSSSRSSM